MSTKTYSEEELAAAVARAVAEQRAETDATVASLTAAQQEADKAAAVAAAVEPLQARVAELQAELDAKVLEAAAEKEAREAAEAQAAAEAAEAAEIAAAAARKDERLAKVKEIATFDGLEEWMTANADRWAAMSDADFDSQLEGFKAIAAKAPAASRTVPRRTAMTAAEVKTPATNTATSPLRELRNRRMGTAERV